MSFVIYEKESTYYIRGMKPGGYKSKSAASAALNRLIKKSEARSKAYAEKEALDSPSMSFKEYKEAFRKIEEKYCKDGVSFNAFNLCLEDEKPLKKDDFAIADAVEFSNNIEKEVERINLMSGLPFKEAANTPIYCSPAFESYWSM